MKNIEKKFTEKVRETDKMGKLELSFNATEIACEVTQNLPECSISMACVSFKYGLEYVNGKFTDKIAPENMKFVFVDEEGDSKRYTMTIKEAEKGVILLINKIINQELFFHGCSSFADLMDMGNWDADVVDAMVQCAVLGDVIYG